MALGDGFVAVAEIAQGEFAVLGPQWPVKVDVLLGVGYEPATALLAELGLPPRATLVEKPYDPDDGTADIYLKRASDVGAVVGEIVAVIDRHARTFAAPLSSPAALEAALTDRAQTDQREEMEGLPLLLAATGEHERARRVIETYLCDPTTGDRHRGYHQFANRLLEWLDALSP